MTKKEGKIVFIDDNEDILFAARMFLKQHFSIVHTEKDPQNIPELLARENYDVILLDMNYAQDVTSGSEGFYWLEKILEIDSSAVVIMITAYGDIDMAVRAIKSGATDFVLKPWQNEKLLATLSSAMTLRQSLLEVNKLRSRQKQLSADLDQRFHNMIGISSRMQDVFVTIQKVADTDANVLILGENGTGKELVARALHRQSHRVDELFIGVDMGAISSTLFESELFGHVKGAFTDAKESRIGRFELASGGTLFLDEIGNLSLELQAKLLGVLETRQIIPLGSNKPRLIDVRLICATNMQLNDLVAQNIFRQDLLYRINTVEMTLPPLRERPEDIPLLLQHFISIFSKKYKKNVKDVNSSACNKLQRYGWPGNIRELRHAIERAVILTEEQVLRFSDFLFPETKRKSEGIIFEDYNLENVEKTVILKALKKHMGNITHVARELGLTRTSLYRRMEKYGL